MLLREVKHALANAALGLQDDLLAHVIIHMDRIGKNLLAFASTVNIRMVKEICTRFERGLYKLLRLSLSQ
ncbi:hypothetical protein D3C77_542950 [compost metagenome]